MIDTIDLIQPKIVRTWFDTILNPMIQGLENEKYFLDKNNLTWRSFNNSFEVLRPISTFFHYKYYANFEQIVEYNSNIIDIINNHDLQLTKLLESCYNLNNVLRNSDVLKTIYYNELNNLKQSNTNLSDYEIDGLENEKNLQYITEYIINNREELESSYTLSPIWNAQINNFKNLLSENELLTAVGDKNNLLDNFKIIVNQTIIHLKKLRNELSMKTGEPLVMFNEN